MPTYLFIHARPSRPVVQCAMRATSCGRSGYWSPSVRADYTVVWKYAGAFPSRATDGRRLVQQNTRRRHGEESRYRYVSLRHTVSRTELFTVARSNFSRRLNCPVDPDAFTDWSEMSDRPCVESFLCRLRCSHYAWMLQLSPLHCASVSTFFAEDSAPE